MKEQYDYIICGAGLAGLSLAYRMTLGGFENKKILILDHELKNKNDRTWCFWDLEKSIFEDIVYKVWDELNFYSSQGKIDLKIDPYRYKMIRGIDFYNHCLKALNASSQIEFTNELIVNIKSTSSGAEVTTDQSVHKGLYVFNSAIREEVDKLKYAYVSQHFKGWYIKTKKDTFNADSATFMDFRINQENQARFFYVLPTDSKTALVEVAIFSNDILDSKNYDSIIEDYIRDFLKLESFDILEKEFGVIPMTNYPFKIEQEKNVFNIGTSGGAVKPSSGYAFKRIQEQCDDIIHKLKAGQYPIPKKQKAKYKFLDGVLLNVVQTNKCSSEQVFSRLFSKYPARLIFKFLDEESSLFEDLKIVSAPPPWPFMKAAFEEIFK